MNERKQKLISLSILMGIIIIAFALYMISLTAYSISYGPDGPWYDIQVREILRTGFPDSTDPPLVYYYLVPFVVITGDSYLGIKIGMSLIAALMAVPAYKLTKLFTGKSKGFEGEIPALLAAFLITTNVYVYRMIGDFMQNLAGVFFLLFFVYYAVSWFENIREWKKNAPLMLVFFVCTFFSHVYPALLASILLVCIFFFTFITKWIKTKKLPKTELLILVIVSVISGVVIIGLVALYPSTFSNITSRLSTYIEEIFQSSTTTPTSIWQSIRMYITIPYIWGIVVIGQQFFYRLKQRSELPNDPALNKKTLLCWMYLVISTILFILSIFPTTYTNRIILLAFIPISLISPIAFHRFQKLDTSLSKSSQKLVSGVIAGVFIVSTLISSISFWSTMGPYITMDEYDELQYIEQTYISTGLIDSSGIIFVEQYHFGYWVEYVLDMDVEEVTNVGETSAYATDFEGIPVYGIYWINVGDSPFQAAQDYSWFPLTPFGFSGVDSRNNPGGIPAPRDAQEPTQLPSIGEIIYVGEYYEVRLLYYADGTQA